MSHGVGTRVRTPEGRETEVIGHTTDVVETRNAKGELVDRIEVPLVTVRLDGAATGSYPAERLTPISEQQEG